MTRVVYFKVIPREGGYQMGKTRKAEKLTNVKSTWGRERHTTWLTTMFQIFIN